MGSSGWLRLRARERLRERELLRLREQLREQERLREQLRERELRLQPTPQQLRHKQRHLL